MRLTEVGRYVNRHLKRWRKRAMARNLDAVRRVERVAPVPGRRVVAMTFDDGPTVVPTGPGGEKGLTDTLLDILRQYGARATFDVIGSTAGNYPDREGRLHTAQWGGVRHDHYPAFGQDALAGVENQPDLARRIVREGHELSNHSYSHVAFGPTRWVYGSRSYLPNLAAVVSDLRRLHDLVRRETGFTMRLGRPPHYIDRTADGKSAYDAYREMGYLYLAASFDGGGWKPSSGDYGRDVDDMVAPLERALAADPESLNGQIIFQKDGYNMSKQLPVVDALPRQLEQLRRHGYEVLTVSELLACSPFTDLPSSDPAFETVRALAGLGFILGYRDNSFQPGRVMTRGELAAMILPPAYRAAAAPPSRPTYADVPVGHPYFRDIEAVTALGWLGGRGGRFRPGRAVTRDDVEELLSRLSADGNTETLPGGTPLTRSAVVACVGRALLSAADRARPGWSPAPAAR